MSRNGTVKCQKVQIKNTTNKTTQPTRMSGCGEMDMMSEPNLISKRTSHSMAATTSQEKCPISAFLSLCAGAESHHKKV